MRALVCGGTAFNDREYLWQVMDDLDAKEGPFTIIIHGAAPGADTEAGIWAKARGKTVLDFPADWKRYGNWAGPMRNGRMLREGRPDVVIAFPGDKGTNNMKRQARDAFVRVIDVPPRGNTYTPA